MTTTRFEGLAEALFGAIERADAESFRACFAPDGVIIQNGGEPRAAQAVAAHIGNTGPGATRHTYLGIRRQVFDGGFVEEHTVRSVAGNGDVLVRHTCVVCDVDSDGRITEMREYLNRSN
ncbi:nuclear transport factor 2 family protein [Gordonia amicalis]|uniref:nuclear transport factor 2 family protein n=1 Tax=Gordonia amicalis TaxID=89053 RepID=UPI0004062AC0|nr:nuclear transport factor 2 family protein [Gordonia amicalis]MCZ4650582.1 nuclear transport factor 2 family protein [Gordonia amicalis]